MSDHLTLHEASEALGVHYMTAYRYVRTGMLDASKSGGTWRVSRHAVEAFRSGGTGPVAPGRRAPWSERLEARLLAGDARGAWTVVESAMTAGTGPVELYLDVLAPAMVRIGERWATGDVDVATEHRASGVALRIVGRLGPRFHPRGRRRRGGVILGAPAGELHSLPVAILGDLLRFDGWAVSDLGADVPTASFAYALGATADVVAVGLSVSSDGNLESVREAADAMRAADPDVLVVVGGRAVAGAAEARRWGGDVYASGGAAMSELLDGHLRGGRRERNASLEANRTST